MNIGGERKTMRAENEPAYTAIYELESPDVLTSAAWNKAVEAGRWPAQVRPHTRNRRHVLLKANGFRSTESLAATISRLRKNSDRAAVAALYERRFFLESRKYRRS